MNDKANRIKTGSVLALGFIFLMAVVVFAQTNNFAGKWKTDPPPAAAAAAAPAGRGGPGGRAGGGGGGGGFQEVTLNLKVNKENKASGNITIASGGGQGTPEDVRDGKIDGNKIYFHTGKPPADDVYEFNGEFSAEELTLTRSFAAAGTASAGRGGGGAQAGGRGRVPEKFVLKRKK